MGGGTTGIAFKKAQNQQDIPRNAKEFCETWGVRWSAKVEVRRYLILSPLDK